LENLLEMAMVVGAGQGVANRLLAGFVVGAGALDGGDGLVGEDLQRADRLERRRLAVVRLLDGEVAEQPVLGVEGNPEQLVRPPAILTGPQHAV
jgi:hypothetical protein